MEKVLRVTKDKLNELPKTAGVYLFFATPKLASEGGFAHPIYIGKAINIRDRVKNHFFQPTYKDDLYIERVETIGFIETWSEIEALVLEASLIKKYQPKFNSVWRDDKNYFYVAIARNAEAVPYVFITHQPGKIQNLKVKSKNFKSKFKINYIGPFTEGNALKKTLKYLRRVFPFYTNTKHPNRKCTWCHLGLCPGPLPDLVEYKKNIKKLALILQGKRKTVLYALKKEMAAFSAQGKFEEAAKVRDKISALEMVMAHVHVISNQEPVTGNQPLNPGVKHLENSPWQKTEKLLQAVLQTSGAVSKIECYDISNIQGQQAVGSMVVFVNGTPDKSQYKKFKIRMENKPNDIAMLKEVLTRRMAHPEWGYPDVMLIDGGIAQLNVGIKAKKESLTNIQAYINVRQIKNIKIISITKGKQELLIENHKEHIPLNQLPQEVYNLIKHLDDEAHRFAITYHKKLRKKSLGI